MCRSLLLKKWLIIKSFSKYFGEYSSQTSPISPCVLRCEHTHALAHEGKDGGEQGNYMLFENGKPGLKLVLLFWVRCTCERGVSSSHTCLLPCSQPMANKCTSMVARNIFSAISGQGECTGKGWTLDQHAVPFADSPPPWMCCNGVTRKS